MGVLNAVNYNLSLSDAKADFAPPVVRCIQSTALQLCLAKSSMSITVIASLLLTMNFATSLPKTVLYSVYFLLLFKNYLEIVS